MKVLSVIPIIKGILKKELTYFSSKDISVGDIVTVKVRKKEELALVTEVSDLASKKTTVRASEFELKKVIDIHAKSPLSPAFIQAVRKTAEYHLCAPGTLLLRMIPKEVLQNELQKKAPVPPQTSSGDFEVTTFQSSFEDRVSFYKTYIRERFAKKESLFICLPTEEGAELFRSALEKGIGNYLFVLHGGLSKKVRNETLKNLQKETHPLVVIATPQYIYTLPKNTNALILEHESSPTYKTFETPLFDIRTFARFFAREQKLRLILADTILQTETIWEVRERDIETVTPLNFRFPVKNKRSIVNTKPEGEDTSWSAITSEFEEQLERTIDQKKRAFVFTLRKGLAPFTVCNDCKKVFTCPECRTPLTLYKQKSATERLFICNTCGHNTSAKAKCGYCDSWDLQPLGVGTENIEEILKERFPNNEVFVLDQNTAKTKTQAKKIIKQFEETPGSILVGTELALHHNLEKVSLVGISSFDSLFAIPSFRIHERILRLLIHLEQLAQDEFLIQTKNPSAPVLTAFRDNSFIQYYNKEITERESFDYPPFTTLIKIIPNAKTKKEEMKKIADTFFKDHKPSLFVTTHRKKKVPALLLKVKRDLWNTEAKHLDPKLKDALFSLPPDWIIHVDPEHT